MTPAIYICNVTVMPVRSEPSHKAEQTTQLLYGEKVLVLETNNKDWARIRCMWDGYEGWCKYTQLSQPRLQDLKKDTVFVSANHKGRILFEHSEMPLPIGSELFNLKKGIVGIGSSQGVFKGRKINITKQSSNPETVKKAALQFLHAPYLWGGRSLAGLDCSGLTQMAYKLNNHKLPRDAAQQAETGILVEFLQNAACGDLAFFDNAEGGINHVGILLDSQHIIHATDAAGRVVVDKIDQGGIISITKKKRTHNLRFVKRIIGSEKPQAKAEATPPTLL